MEINQLTQPSIMLTKAALTNRKNAAAEESTQAFWNWHE
jgi:hypothetical protein